MTNAYHMTLLASKKRLGIKPLITACAITCLLFSAGPTHAAKQLVDRVSVLVNDAAITEGELKQAVAQLKAQNRNAPLDKLRKVATEELIMISLQEQEAKRMGLSVDNATLDRAMQSLARQNNASLTNFRKHVASQGMPWNELRESVRKQILLDRLRDREVMRRINISEQEINDYLAEQDAQEGHPQYHLEHYVLPLPRQADDASKRQAEAAVGLLLNSLDKKLNSEQVVALFRRQKIKLDGGSLGWRVAEDLPEPINEIVPQLMTGEASEPVVDAQGIHVLRLLGVRQTKPNSIEQSKARHILLKLNPMRDANQAKLELETLRKQILNGESFAAQAHKHSEDYGSGVMGGDLGWFGPGAMVPAFESKLKLLAPGQISEPFETPFGWHIVKLEDRRQSEASNAERRQKARMAIAETKRAATTQRWLQQLRDQAFLEYPDN